MSQSDWRFTLKNQYTFLGGTSGSAQQNNLLANPLTASGDWCRIFQPSVDHDSTVAMLPINNSELTSSDGYEYGYAYSLRLSIRRSTYTSAIISFKNVQDLGMSLLPPNSTGLVSSGYHLSLQGSSLFLNCLNGTPQYLSDSLDPSVNNYGFQHLISNTNNNANLWYHYRMDISPVSGSHDRISVYSSNTENYWPKVYEVDIPRTKVAAYIPWKNNPNGDGNLASGFGYMGLMLQPQGVTSPIYIDKFEVYKERVI